MTDNPGSFPSFIHKSRGTYATIRKHCEINCEIKNQAISEVHIAQQK